MGIALIFLHCFLFFSLLFGISFITASLGIFYAILIIPLVIALFIASRKIFIPQNFLNSSPSLKTGEVFTLTLISIIVVVFFLTATPSYLEGRDPGAMVEAAAMLSKNHQLKFQPGSLKIFNNQDSNQLALNYPGFIITHDNQLKTQFNPGYITYLGFWYSLFGENGLKIANAIAALIGLLALFGITKLISKSPTLALSSIIILALSFPFFWFSQKNFTEITAFAFLFSAIYLTLKIFKNPEEKTANQLAGLVLMALLFFTTIRIEGLILFPVFFYLLFRIHREENVSFKNPTFLTPLVLLTFILILHLFSLEPFLKKMAKDILGYSKNSTAAPETFSLKEQLQTSFYVFRVFALYGLLIPVVLGLIKIITLIKPLFLSLFKKEPISFQLIPLLLAGPFLVYFIKPTISLDHPWLLRRFLFACLPLLILYATLFVYEVTKKKTLGLILLAVLVIMPANLFLEYAFTKENPKLKQDLAVLANHFQPEDLIVIDKSSAPDDWSLISSPLRYLFNRNAVYVYNPNDLSKIKSEDFSSVFLITDPQQLSPFTQYLDVSYNPQTYQLHFQQLSLKPFNKSTDFRKKLSLPAYQQKTQEIWIYKLK